MKVLHVEAGTHVYGGALQVLLLVEGLEKQGVENLLVVPEGTELEEEARSRRVPLHALPMAGDADLRLPFRLRNLIKREAPDLIHLHSRRGADTLGALGGLLTGIPTVLTRRVDNPESAWAVAAKYRLYHRVVTISEAIRKVLVKQGVDPRKIRCVRSALDPDSFRRPCHRKTFLREFSLKPEERAVGMAAQFIPRKGHDVLLRAIPAIIQAHPETRFLLFGKGPLHEEIARRVAESAFSDAVRLPGFREDLLDLLPCMDLLVHPASMEGLGIVLLQAGAAGLPVVASDAGGIPEAVVHQKTGFLVPPHDPAALASAVSRLLHDPAMAKAMGEAGRSRIESAFSVDAMVAGNLQVYRELLSQVRQDPT